MKLKQNQGPLNANAKFTIAQVRDIRRERREGKPCKQIAQERNVTVNCVYQIATFRRYGSVL